MSTPIPPDYAEYFASVVAQVQRSPGASPDSVYAGADADVHAQVSRDVEQARDDLVALSHDIHAHPELGYEEHHAARTVASFLTDHGHPTEAGAFGLDTAVHARAGEGHPRVAFLAEYDALPGIGHACGHNVICSTAVGGFVAAAAQVKQSGGSVDLIGTPAEEGGGGKEKIALAGGFDEVDAAVMLHPFFADITDHPFIGVRTVQVVYTGVNAHASALPFMGVNALDAAVLAYTGMAHLRQHMLPSDRVHGIFTDGGQKPNIVPERAALEFYVRSAEPSTLKELCRKAAAVFEGAATQTGCAVEVTWDVTPVYLPTRLNGPLNERYTLHASQRGRTVLPRGLLPEAMTGSTDLGNVSVRIPAIHPMLGIAPFGVSLHTAAFADHARSPAADDGVVDGAIALASTALDYLSDGDLREAVAEEFHVSGGVIDVAAMYP